MSHIVLHEHTIDKKYMRRIWNCALDQKLALCSESWNYYWPDWLFTFGSFFRWLQTRSFKIDGIALIEDGGYRRPKTSASLNRLLFSVILLIILIDLIRCFTVFFYLRLFLSQTADHDPLLLTYTGYIATYSFTIGHNCTSVIVSLDVSETKNSRRLCKQQTGLFLERRRVSGAI